jgi:hypothetical protein
LQGGFCQAKGQLCIIQIAADALFIAQQAADAQHQDGKQHQPKQCAQ